MVRAECNGNVFGSVPHATVCSKFVVCNGKGKGVVKSCPPKTNFDPDYHVCVWENVYSCKGNLIVTRINLGKYIIFFHTGL